MATGASFFMQAGWICTVLCALAASAQASEEQTWTTDFRNAKEEAAKRGKDILLDFTSSDACVWCMRLKDEVFDKAEFKKEAPKAFVLVEVDFPQQRELPDDLQRQNQVLAKIFRIDEFPTLILMDANGRPYARTGYLQGGAAKYLEQLKELREKKSSRDDSFSKASKATGIEKARLVDQALMRLQQDGLLIGYEAEIDEIIHLDADNRAGLKSKYENARHIQAIVDNIEKGELDAALMEVDSLAKEGKIPVPTRQKAYYLKAVALHSKGDEKGTLDALRQAQQTDPDSDLGNEIMKMIEDFKNHKHEVGAKR